MGASLLLEFEGLIAREELWQGAAVSREERDELLEAFLSVCTWSRVYYLWRPNLQDEADNHLIELAVAGGALAIVTKNRRDLESGDLSFGELRIVGPEELLQELGSWQP